MAGLVGLLAVLAVWGCSQFLGRAEPMRWSDVLAARGYTCAVSTPPDCSTCTRLPASVVGCTYPGGPQPWVAGMVGPGEVEALRGAGIGVSASPAPGSPGLVRVFQPGEVGDPAIDAALDGLVDG